MALKFLGRGSGFSDNHTSAYFSTENNEIVIIDCPVSAFQKLKQMNLKDYEKIYVLITHTHGDHIGGLGLFAQYAYFVLKNPINIVSPSADVAKDILTILNIEGNEPFWYNLMTAANVRNEDWFEDCILTEHSPQLVGKCFGYSLVVDGIYVVYTGDTNTMEPFIPYCLNGSILYVDTSVYYGMIHLMLEETLDLLLELNQAGVKIYLMHLDDVEAAKRIVAGYPGIEVVTLD